MFISYLQDSCIFQLSSKLWDSSKGFICTNTTSMIFLKYESRCFIFGGIHLFDGVWAGRNGFPPIFTLRHVCCFVADDSVLVKCFRSRSSKSSCPFLSVYPLLRWYENLLILLTAHLAFERLGHLAGKK